MRCKFKGFTLIELLVVVGIMAILAVVGIAIYSNNLKRTRDTSRKQDIQAIATVLESRYSATGYSALLTTMFVKEEVPFDPLTDATNRATTTKDCGGQICKYCVVAAGTALATAVCDSTTPAIAVGQPPDGSVFIICANLEAGGSFCLKNQQ